MALSIVHFRTKNFSTYWGVLKQDTIFSLPVQPASTAELLQLGYEELLRLYHNTSNSFKVSEVSLLSPITAPGKVLCQGANYRQHMIDSGMNPDDKSFNMFFTKSTASITHPVGQIIKPGHVHLLDYEIELTLVLGKKTTGPVEVTEHNLHEYVAGICIGNDISARDIQIPQMQFHKGKSYRTFCPLGPVLCLLAPDELHYLDQLNLSLKVNGEPRQQDSTANLVFKPAETLTEYSQITDFEPGDVLMTGTPTGCALALPAARIVRLMGLLPESIKWKMFNHAQRKRSQYLQIGDVMESHISSDDGKINLGWQKHIIV